MTGFDEVFLTAVVALVVFVFTLWLGSEKKNGIKLVIATVVSIMVLAMLVIIAKIAGYESTLFGIKKSDSTSSQPTETVAEDPSALDEQDVISDIEDNGDDSTEIIVEQDAKPTKDGESEDTTEENTVYLLDIMSPYEKPYWYDASGIINMGGTTYTHGFTCMGYDDSKEGNVTYFNLEGKFTDLAFTAGIVSGNRTENNVTFTFYADGNIIDSFEMKSGDLPERRSVDVTGCEQLKIVVNDGYWVADGSGTYGLADIQITRNTSDVVSDTGNTELGDEQVYLLDVIEPYEKPYWYNASGIINMGGQAYTHGFTCMGYEDTKEGNVTFFNLDGQFTELAFTAGIVSGNVSENSVTFTLYADGNILDNFEMNNGDLPKPRSVDVTGCKQLKIVVNDGYWVANGSGTYGIVDLIVRRK